MQVHQCEQMYQLGEALVMGEAVGVGRKECVGNLFLPLNFAVNVKLL